MSLVRSLFDVEISTSTLASMLNEINYLVLLDLTQWFTVYFTKRNENDFYLQMTPDTRHGTSQNGNFIVVTSEIPSNLHVRLKSRDWPIIAKSCVMSRDSLARDILHEKLAERNTS